MLRSSLRFSFQIVSYFQPGSNDPGTGGINPWRAFGSGSRGSEAGSGSRSLLCRRRSALIVTAGLAASRWRRTLRYGFGPWALAVRPVFSIPVPGPIFPNNTVKGWLGLEGQWRRIRTFDRQIRDLMLYPTELSVVQTAGFEPATSGSKSGAVPD